MIKKEKEFILEILEPALRNGYGEQLYASLAKDCQLSGDYQRLRFMNEIRARATGENYGNVVVVL